MTISQFAKLEVGDKVKRTYGDDSWVLEVVSKSGPFLKVKCLSGPGGVGKEFDLDVEQNRRSASHYEII